MLTSDSCYLLESILHNSNMYILGLAIYLDGHPTLSQKFLILSLLSILRP